LLPLEALPPLVLQPLALPPLPLAVLALPPPTLNSFLPP
ncbi:hypothetical protein A2U01_0111829, partial [Trifolium medium]|nr:hypothetical protein [Trifolium medium]